MALQPTPEEAEHACKFQCLLLMALACSHTLYSLLGGREGKGNDWLSGTLIGACSRPVHSQMRDPYFVKLVGITHHMLRPEGLQLGNFREGQARNLGRGGRAYRLVDGEMPLLSCLLHVSQPAYQFNHSESDYPMKNIVIQHAGFDARCFWASHSFQASRIA